MKLGRILPELIIGGILAFIFRNPVVTILGFILSAGFINFKTHKRYK